MTKRIRGACPTLPFVTHDAQIDARQQALKNRRCIRWTTVRMFRGREQRRGQTIVCRKRAVKVEGFLRLANHFSWRVVGILVMAELGVVYRGKAVVKVLRIEMFPPMFGHELDGLIVLDGG